MSYAPPSGNSADFFISEAYSVPSGDDLLFSFGAKISAIPESLSVQVSISTTSAEQVQALWTYPSGVSFGVSVNSPAVSFTIVAVPEKLDASHSANTLIAFEGGAIPFPVSHVHAIPSVLVTQEHNIRMDAVSAVTSHKAATVEARKLPDYFMPNRMSGGFRVRFERAGVSDSRVVSPAGAGVAVNKGDFLAWSDAENISAQFANNWEQLQCADLHAASSWAKTDIAEAVKASSFGQLEKYDLMSMAAWDAFDLAEKSARSGYCSPPPVEEFMEIPWGDFGASDPEHRQPERTFFIPWNNPPPVDRPHETLWGKEYYERICIRKYYPPDGDKVDFNIRRELRYCGDEWHSDFFFDQFSYDERCTQREPSGWRENYTFKPPKYTKRPPELGVYIVLNNAMLCRLPDRKPVEVLNMQLSSGIDSWCWDFRATLGSAADLALLKSETGDPVPVEAEINGWKWIVMIEDSSGGRQFPKGSVTVTGRSRSAWLAAPYAPVKTYTETQERLARQLAEAELEYTGWEFDWKIEDWLVPGNVWSVANQTAMDSILKIVRAAGGEIQTHRTDMSLKAVSRFPFSPWNWANETPVIQLHESVIITLGWQNDRRAGYNGIYVSGSTAGGVTVFVSRDGTAGDRQAQMIVDPLITAVEAGRERGRVELAKSGYWSRQSLSLPLMAGLELPGLMECGDLIEVQEGTNFWRGQVASVTVTANRQNGLKVYQNIEVERYHG